MGKMNVRDQALSLLIRIEKEGGFSHLLLSQFIDKQQLDGRDEKLLTELVYGTIERKITLDFYLEPFINKQKKVADWVIVLLRMSIFQYAFLDRVPMYAIINEAVNISKKRGHKGIAAFVNGVLRNVERKGLPDINSIHNDAKRLSVMTSHPLWLVERWIEIYGFTTTQRICEANSQRKMMTVRVNTLKISRTDMIEKLEKDGFNVTASSLLPNAIHINKGNILKTDYIALGLVTIQDLSSVFAASMLDVEEGMAVLDTCSAPGGKTGCIGELMKNTGMIHAYDLYKNKIKLIRNQAKRLGLTNVQVNTKDARQLQEEYNPNRFDRILVDAPCSGFGVIRSKPDIKYTKTVDDIIKLQQIQLEILNSIAVLLKKAGKLVYSTCTIEKRENEDVVKQFLARNHNFQVDPSFFEEIRCIQNEEVKITPYGLQIFPQSFQSDGFFMTRLTKQP